MEFGTYRARSWNSKIVRSKNCSKFGLAIFVDKMDEEEETSKRKTLF
jgi:hypothetical protein